MIYWELFWAFFQVGLFSIGGGYAALPLIQARVVDLHGWLTLTEFADVLTISQMTPGPIGINAATFVGTKIGGLPGALIATAGCVVPSFIIVLALAYIYIRYKNLKIIQRVLEALRPAVVGLIAASGISIVILAFWGGASPIGGFAAFDVMAAILFVAGMLVMRLLKPNPVYVILGTGAVGLVLYWLPLGAAGLI